jgi:MFS family permease
MSFAPLPPRDPSGRRLLRARFAVGYSFLACGLGMGIWATHVPVVRARLALDPAILGIALFVMAAASTLILPLAGAALGRFGSPPTAAVATIAFAICLPLPVLANSVPIFFVSVLLFGAGLGALDVAMNLQATEIEAVLGRPTMSLFHGFFSVGGLAGAGLGSAVIAAGWGDGRGAAAVAAVLLALAILAAFNLWPRDRSAGSGAYFALPNRAVFALGVVAFLSFAVEGAVTNWSALFLAAVKQASVYEAGFGFAAFSVTMAIFRLTGDAVVVRVGAKATVVAGGIIIVVGVALAIAAPWPGVAALGFGLVGVGCANVVPVVFSAASRVPGMSSNLAIAAVTTMGYAGFMAAPPVLGFVADGFGLAVSLAVVAIMGAAIALVAVRSWRS